MIRGKLVHHARGVNGIYLDDGHGGDVPWALPKGMRGERVRRENILSLNWEGTHADAGIEGAVDLAFSLSLDSAVRKSLAGFPLPAAARSGLFLNRWRTTLPSDAETRRLDPRPPRKMFDSQMDVDAR